nr:MAG TPA: hypothetical protein [Caudoviricetes sp.]
MESLSFLRTHFLNLNVSSNIAWHKKDTALSFV